LRIENDLPPPPQKNTHGGVWVLCSACMAGGGGNIEKRAHACIMTLISSRLWSRKSLLFRMILRHTSSVNVRVHVCVCE
jgi:hypothetical protein